MFHFGTSAWHSPKLHLCCRWNFHQSMQSFGLSATWYSTQTVICTSFSDARVCTTHEVRERKVSSSHYHAAEKSNLGCDAASGEWLLAFQWIEVPSSWKDKQSKENSHSSWPVWCLTVKAPLPCQMSGTIQQSIQLHVSDLNPQMNTKGQSKRYGRQWPGNTSGIADDWSFLPNRNQIDYQYSADMNQHLSV